MSKIIRYGSVDNYYEGVVVDTQGDDITVLRMYHVKNHRVQDVWLGDVDFICEADIIFVIKSEPFWYNGVGVAMDAYLDHLEEEYELANAV